MGQSNEKELTILETNEVQTLKTVKFTRLTGDSSLSKALEILEEHATDFGGIYISNELHLLDIPDIISYCKFSSPEKQLQQATVLECVKATGEKKTKVPLVFKNDTLLKLFAAFWGSESHFVGVVSSEGKFEGLISQITICEWVFQNFVDLFERPNISLTDLNLLHRKVAKILSKETPLDAIKLMKDEGMDTICVVDEKHRYVGIFNSSLMKGTAENNINQLSQPISIFLTNATSKSQTKATSCESIAKFKEVLNLLIETKQYRIFVVDPETRPISRVTLSDFIEIVYRQNSKEKPFSATLDEEVEGIKDYNFM